MKKLFLLFFVLLIFTLYLPAADNITGLWHGVDEKTGQTTMYIYIYQYHGKVFGRMVATYRDGVLKDLYNKPEARAEKWKGDPYYAGMDIIWNMEDKGKKWKKGNICDPKEGKIYGCELWKEKGNLIVRGKIGPFGRNQTWLPADKSELPSGLDYGNPSEWVPVIPVLK